MLFDLLDTKAVAKTHWSTYNWGRPEEHTLTVCHMSGPVLLCITWCSFVKELCLACIWILN